MISREEAIKLLHILPVTVFDKDYDKPFRDAIFMAIEALSQPERPKGRWVWKVNKIGNGCHCICSLCGRREEMQEPYCNCGADMRGEEE